MDALDLGIGDRSRLREADAKHDKEKAERSHAMNIAQERRRSTASR